MHDVAARLASLADSVRVGYMENDVIRLSRAALRTYNKTISDMAVGLQTLFNTAFAGQAKAIVVSFTPEAEAVHVNVRIVPSKKGRIPTEKELLEFMRTTVNLRFAEDDVHHTETDVTMEKTFPV